MPRTALKVETFYQFDELSDAAKETAREWWREGEAQEYWFETDDVITIAAILGIEISDHVINMGQGRSPNIFWSHSWSQGDGAMFMGHYKCAKDAPEKIREHAPHDETLHAIADALTLLQAKNLGLLSANISRISHSYNHSGCMGLDMERDEDPSGILPNMQDDISEKTLNLFFEDEQELTRLMRSFADWIFEQVKADYEATMSDENVDESIRTNEYEFDEEGNRA